MNNTQVFSAINYLYIMAGIIAVSFILLLIYQNQIDKKVIKKAR